MVWSTSTERMAKLRQSIQPDLVDFRIPGPRPHPSPSTSSSGTESTTSNVCGGSGVQEGFAPSALIVSCFAESISKSITSRTTCLGFSSASRVAIRPGIFRAAARTFSHCSRMSRRTSSIPMLDDSSRSNSACHFAAFIRATAARGSE